MNQDQIQPDYNFILEQNAPAPKQTSKKGILLVSSLMLLVLVGAGAVLFNALNGAKPQNGSTALVTTDPAGTFVEFMKAQDPESNDNIYGLLGDNLQQYKELEKVSLRRLKISVDFSTCSKSQATTEQATFACTDSAGVPKTLVIKLEPKENRTVIVSHRIEDNA